MKPLLKIQTIPIKIEAQTKRASLEYNTDQPRVNVTRNRGRANIKTTPPRISMDTTEARASAGLRSPSRVISDSAQAGKAAAQESARNYAEQGNSIVDSHGRGNPVADIAASNMGTGQMPQTELSFIPSQGPEISVEPGSISFDYQMDRLTFDWNVSAKPQLEFVPASIEFSVVQYPEVIIEYTGEPIYVPRSANPNYNGTA